jgi:hypothetical protein
MMAAVVYRGGLARQVCYASGALCAGKQEAAGLERKIPGEDVSLVSQHPGLAHASIQPLGDAAVAAILGDASNRSVLKRVWSLYARLSNLLGNTVQDIVPAYA